MDIKQSGDDSIKCHYIVEDVEIVGNQCGSAVFTFHILLTGIYYIYREYSVKTYLHNDFERFDLNITEFRFIRKHSNKTIIITSISLAKYRLSELTRYYFRFHSNLYKNKISFI